MTEYSLMVAWKWQGRRKEGLPRGIRKHEEIMNGYVHYLNSNLWCARCICMLKLIKLHTLNMGGLL